jgi:hypothetical protein
MAKRKDPKIVKEYQKYRACGYSHEFATRMTEPAPVELPKEWSAEEKDTALTMRDQGYSATLIGRAIGRSRCAVLGWLHRNKPRGDFAKSTKFSAKTVKFATDADAQNYDAASHKLTMMELGRNECKFPVEGEGYEARFCGQHTEGTYCAHHHARCYRTPEPFKRTRQMV